MARGTPKHIHKYMQTQLKFTKVWRCALPDCRHFMPPHQEELLIGRSSICWGCGEKFTLDEIAMMDDMPNCFTCRNPTVETDLGDSSELTNFINQKLKAN